MFIYFNKLKFDKDKNFTLSFSDDDAIRNKKCFIKKKRLFYHQYGRLYRIIKQCKKSSQHKKTKQISDWVNDILTSGIDFGFKLDNLVVKDFSEQDYVFQVDTKHRSHFIESIEFFDLKQNNETRTVNVYSPFEELKFGIKF